MPATLRVLLDDDSFPLRVLTALDDRVLDRPVSWVHSSDLMDPTPWLEPGNLLLTNGAQFSSEPDAEEAVEYCRRLRAHGVVGLGFATQIIHDRVPDAVVRAGEAVDLPIVEIAARAPFIRIIRFVADIIAADRAARLSWLLDAQRAVARAAVRDDGLRGILQTLSHVLGAWVELYDAVGGRLSLPGLRSAPVGAEVEVGRDVRRLLERRTAASLTVPSAGHALLQTIGQSSRLRGVLAVGGAEPLDPAGKELVTTVVALASIALEQQRGVQTSLRGVRAGVVEMLLDGHGDTARRVADSAIGGLPAEPYLIGVLRGASATPGLLDELDLVSSDPRRLFSAERGDDVIVLVAEGAGDALAALAERRGLAVGTARHEEGEDLAPAFGRAAQAARDAPSGTVRAYADLARRGLVGALRERGGEVLARSLLEPLDALPPAERQRLRESARVWLEANGAWDPAARALGIHRHTLKARLTQLEGLLRLDLSTFAARAELWAALEFSDDGG
ncbi:PucR family transcriptional regulator [Microbacterium proteolyticum]|uniref:PucR family transcriptional regulator n=1 Tax=Microbacterium proteolyticum TaxID=1572644 RepID=UPI001FABAC34|nr:PucR family transcriptional regulator [Microbacterium proteolyticum]MCI9858334.1 PucR family transcriptional regulator [Microbacterium proteolyticum]